MYGPPPRRKRKMMVTCWSAQMYTAFCRRRLLRAMMECTALSPSLRKQSCKDFFTLQVSRAPGLTVESSHCSPADLAGNHNSVVVAGLRMWESRMRFPSLAEARRHLQASQAAPGLINTGGRYASFFASTAQAIRASLLASATTETLGWVRADSCASHALRPEVCLARHGISAKRIVDSQSGSYPD
jgi:hypothetical protein